MENAKQINLIPGKFLKYIENVIFLSSQLINKVE